MSLNTSKKINKLKIENFQSWKQVEIDFDTFNIIEGKSSSGKTAILRAISMVLNNDWDTSWLRKGESKARVTLFYDDGTALIRCRGSENSVSLVQDGRVIDKWVKDISNSYPPEVRNIINIEEYNFSGQFDGHFFIGLSPNKRAEALGEFSDLSKIDQLISLESLPTESEIKDITSLLKNTVALISHLEQLFTLKKINEDLESVDLLDECLYIYDETKRLLSCMEVMKANEKIKLLKLEKKELEKSIEGSFCPICSNIISYS